MLSQTDKNALKATLEFLYGDLLDQPLLRAVEAKSSREQSMDLAAFAKSIQFCQACSLHIGRRNLVFGRGSLESEVVFVGDFPSAIDDDRGTPFADEAGDLLQKMIVAMKLAPEETYLTNLFKCKPPFGQSFDQDLAVPCTKHLQQQFSFLPKAKFIVAMGDEAAKTLARSGSPLGVLRKQEFSWENKRVFCTHHPRDLLQSPQKKKEAWDDLKIVMRAMGL